ncbi:MAG: hypothetical protein RL648_258 [Verrucomicrobiota bacterium]|jgi:protein-tyrosine phosphatase
MASKLLEHALRAQPDPLCSIEVRSAGVSAFAGDPPSSNAIKAMLPVRLDISDHRSRPLHANLIDQSDLILGMTSSHLQLIREAHPTLSADLQRFREWMPHGSKEVPDPFGGPLELYVETRDALAEAIPSIINHLKSLIHEH